MYVSLQCKVTGAVWAQQDMGGWGYCMVLILFEVLGKQPEQGWAQTIVDMQTRNWTTQPLCLDLEARERQAQAQGSEEEDESRSTTTLEQEVSTQIPLA